MAGDPGLPVFAYGTLMFPAVMKALTGRVPPSFPAAVNDYARHAMKGEAYPALVREPGARTEGVVYKAVGAGELTILDAFEGGQYERIVLEATRASGEKISCQGWILLAKDLSDVERTIWSPESFSGDDLRRYIALCRRFRKIYDSGAFKGWDSFI